jgi:signal transduction histidine kinase
LREALTNIARHARATTASVTLEVAGRECRLEVHDDGRGMVGSPAPGGGHGLPNMASRAEGLGGDFEVLQPDEGGTTLVWRAPIDAGAGPGVA